MRLLSLLLLTIWSSAACLKYANVQCEQSSNCDLQPNGVCATAPGGDQWCAYPDRQCPSGYSYSTQAIGDGLAGTCVPDASLPSGTKPPSCKVRVAFEEGQYFPLSDTGTREVWTTNIDGSDPINVSKAPTTDNYDASWSPDGQKLLFLSNRSNIYHLYVVNADGNNLTDLTPNSQNDIAGAVWSPDGSRIAFLTGELNGLPLVWVMRTDGANAAPVSDLVVLELIGWSPDSQKILVSHMLPSSPPGSFGPIALFILSADTNHSSSQQFTNCSCSVGHEDWTPSPQIVWDYQSDIFTASTDLQIIRNVTEDSSHHNARPRMSPDGQTIVFQSNISGHNELWSVNLADRVKTRLTRNGTPYFGNDNDGDVLNSISDDGSLVAFTRIPSPASGETDLRGDIGIMDIHGTSLHVFNAPNGTNARRPVLSHCSSN